MYFRELHSQCHVQLKVAVVDNIISFVVKIWYQLLDLRCFNIFFGFDAKHIKLFLGEHVWRDDGRLWGEGIISVFVMEMSRII